MSQLIFAVLIGIVTVFAFRHRMSMEEKLKFESVKKGHKTALIEPLMLPICIVTIFITLLIMDGGLRISAAFVDWGLLFVYISVYYAVLLLLLPLLRRMISAWACATLWLIPSLLYSTIHFTDYVASPRLIITVPQGWLSGLIWIWAVGFVAVVNWQLLSHCRYRRSLLKGAEEFTDTAALSLWHSEAKRHGIKPEIPVLISEAVNTPITIGCFDRTMRLFMPKQNYTEEELRLVFRHELRHILRADTRTKLFIGFCAAICWFSPLSWIARRKASEIAVQSIGTDKWDSEYSGYSSVYGWNESSLTAYISSLRVKQVYSGNYTFAYHDVRYLSVDYAEVVDGEVASLTRFVITDELLVANIPYDDYGNIIFLLDDEIDWEYLNTLLDFDAENPDPAPQPPQMLMYFAEGLAMNNEPMYAMRTIHSVRQNGESIAFSEHLSDSGIGGVSGAPVTEVRLDFTYPPQGDFIVKVEKWDHSDFYTVASSQLTGNVLPLADYSAHYTISGLFKSYRGTEYDMSFAFDVELP